jgi:hypothetical protein
MTGTARANAHFEILALLRRQNIILFIAESDLSEVDTGYSLVLYFQPLSFVAIFTQKYCCIDSPSLLGKKYWYPVYLFRRKVVAMVIRGMIGA